MLRPLQSIFEAEDYPDLLVGLGAPDDAAVWRLDDASALVVTTDFFTPVVDDPYSYGAIAAANALSDLYAMGATPLLALNIVAMPVTLDAEVIAEILRGGADKVKQAGAVIAGGHTIQDREPKYGLVAIGIAEQNRLLSKGGARAGDWLFLTKPLGTGVTTTALKNERADPADVEEAIGWMAHLNRDASRLAVGFNLKGGTDITGFGLLGHAIEMAEASGVGLRFHMTEIPFLQGARKYAEQGFFPGGSNDNYSFFSERVEFDQELDDSDRRLLLDAQTSGGLLLAVPAGDAERFALEVERSQVQAWPIGMAEAGGTIRVVKRPLLRSED